MKRKTLWAFALILWLLIFSTVFSLWVEKIMVPWVTTTQPSRSTQSMGEFLPLDCLTEDEDGFPVIYQTYEGMGWEEGTRVSILSPDSYQIGEESIDVNSCFAPVVRYSTKGLEVGKLVNLLSSQSSEQLPDTLLVLSSQPLPPLKEELPETYRVLDRTDTSLLVYSEKSSLPFLPKKADTELFPPHPSQVSQRKAYSFAEIGDFTEKLLLLALCLSFVLITLILWGFSCTLIKNPKKNRTSLILNGSLSAVFLLATPFLLNAAQLPSSLLPRKMIVEFGHYVREFSQIFPALGAFSGQQEAQALLSHSTHMLWLSLGILLLGILLAAGLVFLERRRSKPAKEKYQRRH